VSRELRASGTFRSTAEVIEGVRLAEAMAHMKKFAAYAPRFAGRRRDVVGAGDPSVRARSMLRIRSRHAIGSLAKGVQNLDSGRFLPRTHLLKLDQFKAAVRRELELDLREIAASRVPKPRSRPAPIQFLHRLAVLEVGFGKQLAVRQDGTTWQNTGRCNGHRGGDCIVEARVARRNHRTPRRVQV